MDMTTATSLLASAPVEGSNQPDVMSVILKVGDPVVVLVLGVAGVLLLLWGGRLLRPGVLLAAVVLGAGLGLRLAMVDEQGGLFGLPPMAWVIGTPILAGILALLLCRLFLASLLAISAASAGFLGVLVAVAIMGEGTLASGDGDGGSKPEHVVAAEEPTGEEAGSGEVLERLKALATSQAEEEARARLRTELDSMGRTLASGIDSGVLATLKWLWARAQGLEPSIRALGLAVAVVCGLLGFLLGLISPDRVARVATAVVGGWLLAAVVVAAWNRFGVTENGPPPLGMLIGWGVVSTVGIVVQCTKKPAPTDEAT